MSVLSAFCDELEKIAASIDELQAAYRRINPLRLPKNYKGGALMTQPSLKQIAAANDYPVSAVRQYFKPKFKPGTITTTKGGIVKALAKSKHPGMPELLSHIKTPEGQRALNVTTGIHEGFERGTKPSEARLFGTHLSPAVLYREHNMMVRATGKGADEARAAMKTLREGPEGDMITAEAQKVAPGFRYGEGERLNRHQIKRIMKRFPRE